ncbi:MAG: amidase [Kineosporiaceae bacterium]
MYRAASGVGLARLVSARRVSAVEVASAALREIEELDGHLRAFVEVWAERALAMAADVDRRIADGEALPLAGVPLALKASEGLDSDQAHRLLSAGCVPLGTTAVPGPGTEWKTWGLTPGGRTRNPRHQERTPGGSSAGSAVAVAAGMTPLATGSDGAGSIRIPAAWCGVVGLKTTTGLLPPRDRAGFTAGGVLVRHPHDAGAYLDAVAPTTAAGPTAASRSRGPRVAWSATLGYAAPDEMILDTVRRGAARLFGDDVTDVDLVLHDPAEAWASARGRLPVPMGDARQRALRAANDRALADLFAEADVLLTPTTPHPPHGHDGPGQRVHVALTWAFNLSGHPAITVPVGHDPDGLPVGLQMVAPHGHDRLLIALAAGRSPGSGEPTPP